MVLPRMYDHVYNDNRYAIGRNPHGWVVHISNSYIEPEVLIKYAKRNVSLGYFDPEWLLPGGDCESMSFEEFEDYKVSSVSEGKFEDHRTNGRLHYERERMGKDTSSNELR